jgi:hypothetical protein
MAARFTSSDSLQPGDLLEARIRIHPTVQQGGLFGLGHTVAPHPGVDSETAALRERLRVVEAELTTASTWLESSSCR